VEQFQVIAPPEAKQLIREAAKLMTRTDDPLEPRAALRKVGGANEPEPTFAAPALVVELEVAQRRIIEIERQVEARRLETEAEKRQRQALEAERDAARAAEAAEREKAQATAAEAQAAATAAQEAQKRATEALQRAKAAETAIRHARSLPGLRGRLVRWLAGDVLE
jgi:chromosome segregation ATPase